MFKNKALWITIAIIVVLLFAGYSWVKGTYNTMVTQDEGVKTAWSQVENQYQRRMDLIPNLVNTVKGYACPCSRRPGSPDLQSTIHHRRHLPDSWW